LFSNLILSHPWWTVIPVIAVGLLYAGTLYFRNKSNKINRFWTVILFGLRFLSVSLLAFLLLSPFLRTKKKIVEKPIVVLAYDNSRSVLLGKDSSLMATTLLNQSYKTADELTTKYHVDKWVFDGQTKRADFPDFKGEVSDYAQMLRQLQEHYKGANLGALVVFGDGIYNRGIDPLYAASGMHFPVYTVALGDTGVNKDLKINNVRFNSLVYLGDQFPIEVNVSANGLKGAKATLKILAFGKEVARKNISITKDFYNQSFAFQLDAEKKGNQHIRLILETKSDEINRENNKRSLFIDVLNNRQKILILAHSPHPDLGALKESIEQSKNYLAEIQYAGQMKARVSDYDLVILHQLPSANYPITALLEELQKQEIPLLFILGKQSSIKHFNKFFTGFSIRSSVGNFEEAQANINPRFSRFTFPSALADQLEKFPPLSVPLGNYKLSQGTAVFAFQEIKRISTNFPLIAFADKAGYSSGVIAGEGLWLWRIHNYLMAGNRDAFNTFIDKTVQLLMAKKDKRHFKVITSGTYRGNQNVVLSAELYNDAYEAVNETDVNLKLTNEDGEQFSFVFSPFEENYILNLKQLSEGVYQYQAQTHLGNKNYTASGEFVVSSQSLESQNLQANHRMLYRLATAHEGQMLLPDQIESLPALLAARDDLKSRVHYEEHFSALHSLLAVLLLILGLLSLEWFLRKYFGSY